MVKWFHDEREQKILDSGPNLFAYHLDFAFFPFFSPHVISSDYLFICLPRFAWMSICLPVRLPVSHPDFCFSLSFCIKMLDVLYLPALILELIKNNQIDNTAILQTNKPERATRCVICVISEEA